MQTSPLESPTASSAGSLLFDVEGLRIFQSAPTATTVRLDWHGRSAARRPDEHLSPMFSAVLARAKAWNATVELHFENLEFFNSSTVAALVQFIHRARASSVPVSFIYRPSVRWQKLSFEALRVFHRLDRSVQVIPLAG